MKDIGFNTQNKEEREKNKVTDEMTGWYRNPIWLQTLFVGVVVLGFLILNWPALSVNLTDFVVNITSFKVVDLFAVSFIIMLMLLMYFVLVTIWTGGITNKMVYAKLFKKRTMWHLGEDSVMHLYLPDTKTKGWWKVKGVGEFNVVKDAMFWMSNGALSMLTIFGHPEGVSLHDIKDKAILKIDPKNYESRNTEARLEGIEAAANPLSQLNLAVLIPMILIIGVASYLIIGQMQTGECQANLVKLAQTCGETAKTVADVTPKGTADNIISSVTGK